MNSKNTKASVNKPNQVTKKSTVTTATSKIHTNTNSSKNINTNKNSVNVNVRSSQTHYLKLNNQQYLVRTLRLLGVTEAEYFKETKLKLEAQQIYSKHQPNFAASKQFFYICYISMKYLLKQSQMEQLSMWYPPRTVSEQLEFKKALWKLLQTLQSSQYIPKNILISKNSLLSPESPQKLIQFLRFLSQLALRNKFISDFSHKQKLIQISNPLSMSVNHEQQNNVNKFYSYPFVPQEVKTTQINIKDQQSLDTCLEVYRYHIQHYHRKIRQLSTKDQLCQAVLPHKQILCRLTQQKQLFQTLTKKIPKRIRDENRAFDRRRIIDQNLQIWEQLNHVDCHYIQRADIPIIQIEGEIDQILKKWNAVKGITNILEANSLLDPKMEQLRKNSKVSLQNFKNLKETISNRISNK